MERHVPAVCQWFCGTFPGRSAPNPPTNGGKSGFTRPKLTIVGTDNRGNYRQTFGSAGARGQPRNFPDASGVRVKPSPRWPTGVYTAVN